MTAIHVSPGYRHVGKSAFARGRFDVGSSSLKWYDLARASDPVCNSIRRNAQDYLKRASQETEWALDGDVGFVMLHRCGSEFYFLIVCTWRGDNELWETVYFKPDRATPDFAPFPQDRHKGTFCVWEMGIVGHESKAWTRFLLSDRSAADLDAYWQDGFSGDV